MSQQNVPRRSERVLARNSGQAADTGELLSDPIVDSPSLDSESEIASQHGSRDSRTRRANAPYVPPHLRTADSQKSHSEVGFGNRSHDGKGQG